MKRTVSRNTNKGFALPTVMIASVVMLMVLLSGLVASSSVNTSLKEQYKQKILKQAEESAREMAIACIAVNPTPTWSNASPLRPNTNCAGGSGCTNAASCYVLYGSNLRTTFSVGTPTLDANGTYSFSITASLDTVRSSNGSVVSTRSNNALSTARGGWKLIKPGYTHTCAISLRNNTYCWGDNTYGQLGINSTDSSRLVPTKIAQGAIPAGLAIKDITLGTYHTCALATDNQIYCWGVNTYGEVGNNSSSVIRAPVAITQTNIPLNSQFKSVASYNRFTCALATVGNAYCWGYNSSNGQLGNGTTTQSRIPVAVNMNSVVGVPDKQFASIAVGDLHACGLTGDGKAYCWGANNYGQLVNPIVGGSTTPIAATAGSTTGIGHKKISLGTSVTCVIASDDKAHCAGWNAYRQLATTDTSNSKNQFLSVQTALGVLAIEPGNETTCALTTDRKVLCMGRNNTYGKIGNGTTTDFTATAFVDITAYGSLAGKVPVQLEFGYDHACVLDTIDSPHCWGYGLNGQLGLNSTSHSYAPANTRKIIDTSFGY